MIRHAAVFTFFDCLMLRRDSVSISTCCFTSYAARPPPVKVSGLFFSLIFCHAQDVSIQADRRARDFGADFFAFFWPDGRPCRHVAAAAAFSRFRLRDIRAAVFQRLLHFAASAPLMPIRQRQQDYASAAALRAICRCLPRCCQRHGSARFRFFAPAPRQPLLPPPPPLEISLIAMIRSSLDARQIAPDSCLHMKLLAAARFSAKRHFRVPPFFAISGYFIYFISVIDTALSFPSSA